MGKVRDGAIIFVQHIELLRGLPGVFFFTLPPELLRLIFIRLLIKSMIIRRGVVFFCHAELEFVFGAAVQGAAGLSSTAACEKVGQVKTFIKHAEWMINSPHPPPPAGE